MEEPQEMPETDSELQKLGQFQGQVLTQLKAIEKGVQEIREDQSFITQEQRAHDTRITKTEAQLEYGAKRFASHEADLKGLDKSIATKVGKDEFDEKLDTKVRGLFWKIFGGMAGTGAGGGGLWLIFDMLSKGPQ